MNPRDIVSEPQETFRSQQRLVAYVFAFLFTLHYTLAVYINSSFLAQFTGEKFVGALYTIASIIAVFVFIMIPKKLARFGNYRVMMTMLIIEFISLIGMALIPSVFFVVPLFIASNLAVAIIGLNIDIFVEQFSTDKDTGFIRGILLTCSNVAWAISPAITGVLLEENQFTLIYLISAVILLPVIYIVKYHMSKFKDPQYIHVTVSDMVSEFRKNPDIHNVVIANLLLQFFYAWMVIYTPIYLSKYIGFNWDTIGIIFSIMLLPYLFIQLPIGRLADKIWGEKEFMTIGFIIMAISTGIISYIADSYIPLWIALLFTTRIGASMVEAMVEVYFFKNVKSSDVAIVSMWKSLRPVSYIFSPVIATIFLAFFDIRYIFLALGFIMFYGIRYSLALKDTR